MRRTLILTIVFALMLGGRAFAEYRYDTGSGTMTDSISSMKDINTTKNFMTTGNINAGGTITGGGVVTSGDGALTFTNGNLINAATAGQIYTNAKWGIGVGLTSVRSTLSVRGSEVATTTPVLLISDSTPTDRVAVLNNGNVGIGTTSPRAPLDIPMTTQGAYIGNDFSVNNALLRVGTDPTQGLTVFQNGNIGIGTTSSLAELTLKNNTIIRPDADGATAIRINTASATNPIVLIDSTNRRVAINNPSTINSYVFDVNGTSGSNNVAMFRNTAAASTTASGSFVLYQAQSGVALGAGCRIFNLNFNSANLTTQLTGARIWAWNPGPAWNATGGHPGSLGFMTTSIGDSPVNNFAVFTSEGYMGVGTTAPAAQLTIASSGSGVGQGLRIDASTANDASVIRLRAAGTATDYILFINSTGAVTTRVAP